MSLSISQGICLAIGQDSIVLYCIVLYLLCVRQIHTRLDIELVKTGYSPYILGIESR